MAERRQASKLMITIRLKGHVTPTGKLEFDPPAQLPPGQVDITLEIHEPTSSDQDAFTEAEIQDLLTFEPMSGADVVAAGLTGTWADLDIEDPVAWVEEQRQKQQAHRAW
ncbi:MAG: hypothetical protein KC519_14985 [Anaerolineae bacterium]|nr:hypothetical protein [Anaerolineae bacterium]